MPSRYITDAQKQVVVERAQNCCEYCRSQARFATESFSVEHIIPRSQGGETALDNLALAGQGCNNHKYNKVEGRDPTTGDNAPLYHPRQQLWRDHFVWNDDYALVIGLTPTGRVTVETLQLNREGVVNLRRILAALGEHPPRELEDKA